MTEGQHELTGRQRLGTELRRLRMLAGVSGRAVAQRAGLSQSKVSRIERGEAVPSLPEVTAWARETHGEDNLDHLVALTHAALNDINTYEASMRSVGLPGMQAAVQATESQAHTARSFQPAVVPALLQTADYARRIFAVVDTLGDQDQGAAVQARLDRQAVLYQQDHAFEFIMTEGALCWRPGPVTMMRAQLDRIASLATLPNVSLGIVPLRRESKLICWHGFTIYDDLDDEQDPFVQVETFHAHLTISDADDVGLYARRFREFGDEAVYGENAMALISDMSIELGDDRGFSDASGVFKE